MHTRTRTHTYSAQHFSEKLVPQMLPTHCTAIPARSLFQLSRSDTNIPMRVTGSAMMISIDLCRSATQKVFRRASEPYLELLHACAAGGVARFTIDCTGEKESGKIDRESSHRWPGHCRRPTYLRKPNQRWRPPPEWQTAPSPLCRPRWKKKIRKPPTELQEWREKDKQNCMNYSLDTGDQDSRSEKAELCAKSVNLQCSRCTRPQLGLPVDV